MLSDIVAPIAGSRTYTIEPYTEFPSVAGVTQPTRVHIYYFLLVFST